MKKIINECPKTLKKYKNWLKSQYPEMDSHSFLTDNLLITSIETTPISMVYFFDSIGFIGSICYNGLESRFEISVNGVALEDENPNVNHVMVGNKDRKEAEKILIKYLFTETEKTL